MAEDQGTPHLPSDGEPAKPFKPIPSEEPSTHQMSTSHILPATGNDATGNSYCDENLDGKDSGYGFKQEGTDSGDATKEVENVEAGSSEVDDKQKKSDEPAEA